MDDELQQFADDPSADYELPEQNSSANEFTQSDPTDDELMAEKHTNKQSLVHKKKLIREWIEALVFAFFGVLLLKLLVFEPFAIPSDSMDQTLQTGDYIIVNKLAYGARLPMTPLSLPFSHQKLAGTERRAFLDWWQWDYHRLPGYSEIKRNDVIVFNFPAEDLFALNGHTEEYPVDHRTYFIKRVVAIPGDTFLIQDRTIYINKQPQPPPAKAKFNYIIKLDSSHADSINLRTLGLLRESRQGKLNIYTVTLLPHQADSLSHIKYILAVDPELSKTGSYDEQLFPHTEAHPWNLDNYGELIIPKAGLRIRLTVDNLPLYERIIVNYENNRIETRGDSLFINGKSDSSYTFKMNYYFVMGDNRHYSMDSRYWGFVPEDHIVGRASLILFSYDRQRKKVRWGRNFTKIN